MFKSMILVLPYSIGIFLSIILPAIVIAIQEQQIEGPFGWSSATFTKRWPTKSLISKIFRFVVGKDKWATGYHLASNILWIQIFMMSLIYIPLFMFFTQVKDIKPLISVVGVAIFSYFQLVWIEDYIWFLIHKYYGAERHTKEYVPWFQNYSGKIPKTYWYSILAGLVIILATTVVTGKIDVLIIWAETMFFLLITISLIIKPIGGKMKREAPVKKRWWEDKKVEVLLTIWGKYPLDDTEPSLEPNVFVCSIGTLWKLIETREAVRLKDAIKDKKTP